MKFPIKIIKINPMHAASKLNLYSRLMNPLGMSSVTDRRIMTVAENARATPIKFLVFFGLK